MTATFASEHVAADDLRLVRRADMRYQGQEHTVTVPIPEGPLDEDMAEVRRRFDDAHERLYTFRLDVPAELVTFRLTGYGTVPKPPLRELAAGGDTPGAHGKPDDRLRRARAGRSGGVRPRRTRSGRRDRRACRDRGDGDDDARPPGMSATVDRFGNIIVRTGA